MARTRRETRAGIRCEPGGELAAGSGRGASEVAGCPAGGHSASAARLLQTQLLQASARDARSRLPRPRLALGRLREAPPSRLGVEVVGRASQRASERRGKDTAGSASLKGHRMGKHYRRDSRLASQVCLVLFRKNVRPETLEIAPVYQLSVCNRIGVGFERHTFPPVCLKGSLGFVVGDWESTSEKPRVQRV